MAKPKRKRTEQSNKCPSENVPRRETGTMEQIDIERTNATLRALLLNPSLLQTTSLKSIRVNLYSLLKALSLSSSVKLYTTSQLTNLVNDSLEALNWPQALLALDAMIELKKVPKLGSIQRWISRITWEDEQVGRALLRAIIRVSGQSVSDSSTFNEEIWNAWDAIIQDTSMTRGEEEPFLCDFKVLTNEQDINFKHIKIYMDASNTLLFPTLTNERSLKISSQPLPFIQNGLSISNVLDVNECKKLVELTESITFEEASGYALSSETANLERGASGLVICMSPENTEALYSRIKTFLPRFLAKDYGEVCGINARFRFYKYRPGEVYKPHIDGAWSGSGYTEQGAYLIDAFGDRHSRMTMIIYLNDGSIFNGGETRFYGVGEDDNELITYSVKPQVGGCILFPHGDAHIGIVHEGCPVLEGVKYIIRSDILYLNK